MRTTFATGKTPESAYEDWRKSWVPPLPIPMAIRGMVLVEFSPPANSGRFFMPEEHISNNAKVIHDGDDGHATREGYLPVGTEICYTGTAGECFVYRGRTITRLKKRDIEMIVTG